MDRRHIWWEKREHEQRAQRAARWRKARDRLFALPAELRRTVRQLWRSCPYPADPAYLLDLLHQIAVGRVNPHRPPWVFDGKLTARTTPNPEKFDEAFRQISAELSQQYILSYYPEDESDKQGAFRQISLNVKNRQNLSIRTRKGYYVPRKIIR